MKRIPALLSLFLTTLLIGQEMRPNHALITNEQIWRLGEFSTKGVRGFRSMSSGEEFTRLVNNKILVHRFEDFSGEPKVLLDGNSLKYKDQILQIEEYEFNKEESQILIATNTKPIYRYSYTAFYFVYDIASKTLIPVDDKRPEQTLAEFSPDGAYVSFIYGNNLFVKEMRTGKITQMTRDGEKNKIINGTTDWVYEEEFAITKAYQWSPNSEYIAFLKFDEAAVKEFTMTFYNKLYPDLETWKYPKAGEDNSKVTLHLQRVGKKKASQIDIGSYEYIPRFYFSPKSTLVAQTLNRHQNLSQFFKFNVQGKSNKAELFHKHEDRAYVEIDDNLIFESDGLSFYTTSDKDGYKHIYQVFLTGKSEQITNGKWDVIEVKGFDPVSKMLYYTSAQQGATQKDLYAIQVENKKNTKLSTKKGQTDATFSAGMKYFIQTWSDANTPPEISLHRKSGEQIEMLEDNRALREKLVNYKLVNKEFFQVLSGDGQTMLNAWIIKPKNFDSTKTYPVYLFVYGGPGSNTVNDRWEGSNYMYHQLLSQKGYFVVSVDPRGTQFRGSEFMKSTYLQLGKLELQDFISAANELKKLPYIDGDRIGIQGWSYGGYMSSLAMTKGAPTFKMGIAVAPVTNWKYYDNIYTERFMRTPKENNNGYEDNSPVNFCDKLEGKYLLVHGSGDDNVHYQNTMEMIKAMVEANKQFDLFIYPNKNHGIYGGNTRLHLFNMMLDFTLKNL